MTGNRDDGDWLTGFGGPQGTVSSPSRPGC